MAPATSSGSSSRSPSPPISCSRSFVGSGSDDPRGHRPDRALRGGRWSRSPTRLAAAWPGSTRPSATLRSSAPSSACSAGAVPTTRTGNVTPSTVLVFTWSSGGPLRHPAPAGPPALNPDHMKAVSSHLALNTAASFITNTNFQFYARRDDDVVPDPDGGPRRAELLLAGGRLAVLAASIRGLARARAATSATSGSTSTARSPTSWCRLSIVFAVFLISQGVPQTFDGHATATTLQGAQQTIARGPVASQEAIKMIGTNGGGYYNSNSAVPSRTPTGSRTSSR